MLLLVDFLPGSRGLEQFAEYPSSVSMEYPEAMLIQHTIGLKNVSVSGFILLSVSLLLFIMFVLIATGVCRLGFLDKEILIPRDFLVE